jgi:hypothetical protein
MTVYLRDLWPTQAEINASDRRERHGGGVPLRLRDVFAGDERWQGLTAPARPDLRLARLHLHPQAALLRGHDPGGRRGRTSAAPAAWRCSVTPSPPTTSPRRAPSRPSQPRRPVPHRARGGARGLQLLRLPPRQPRGDDARDLRQHPPAQPHGARHRGRRDPAPALRRAPVHLRRGHALPGRGRPGHRASPARSTAPAPPGTGRPRARACSGCGR